MRSALSLGLLTVLSAWCSCAGAAEVKLLSVLPAKEVVLELAPEFEKSTGHKLIPTWTGSVDLRKRVSSGETYDLIITVDKDIEGFVSSGTVLAGSKVDLMKSGIGIAVREGLAKPNIKTAGDLKAYLLSAKAVGSSSGSSGAYLEALFERLGIADQIKPKLRKVASGQVVGQLLTSGDADVGFQQISEIIHYPGIQYVGPLPPDVQETVIYSAAISKEASQKEAAKAFQQILASPAAAGLKTEHGLEPFVP